MPNLQEIIDRAEQLAAGTAQDPVQSAVVDSALTAETIFPHAVRFVLGRMAASGEYLQDITSIVTVSIVDGIGDLPDMIIKAALDQAVFPGRPFVSHLQFGDYQRYRFNPQLNYFTVLGNQLYFTDGTPDAPYNGDVQISVAQVPELPADINDSVPLSEATVEAVILTIAKVLRGEMRLEGLN